MRENAKARLRQSFERLPERERKIVVLLYVHNLTMREIGQVLGVTESRICQLHGQIAKKLRAELEVDEQLFSEVA
jgi:RNA polymerase sigma factor FliA